MKIIEKLTSMFFEWVMGSKETIKNTKSVKIEINKGSNYFYCLKKDTIEIKCKEQCFKCYLWQKT